VWRQCSGHGRRRTARDGALVVFQRRGGAADVQIGVANIMAALPSSLGVPRGESATTGASLTDGGDVRFRRCRAAQARKAARWQWLGHAARPPHFIGAGARLGRVAHAKAEAWRRRPGLPCPARARREVDDDKGGPLVGDREQGRWSGPRLGQDVGWAVAERVEKRSPGCRTRLSDFGSKVAAGQK
jgi:hypothetical protein